MGGSGESIPSNSTTPSGLVLSMPDLNLYPPIGNEFPATVEKRLAVMEENGSSIQLPSTSAAVQTAVEREAQQQQYNVHTFFDPLLIPDGQSCDQTGVRSVVDVPPNVHYAIVGSLSGLTPVMAAMVSIGWLTLSRNRHLHCSDRLCDEALPSAEHLHH